MLVSLCCGVGCENITEGDFQGLFFLKENAGVVGGKVKCRGLLAKDEV